MTTAHFIACLSYCSFSSPRETQCVYIVQKSMWRSFTKGLIQKLMASSLQIEPNILCSLLFIHYGFITSRHDTKTRRKLSKFSSWSTGASDELLTFQYFVLEDGVEVPRLQKIQKVPKQKKEKWQLLFFAAKRNFQSYIKSLGCNALS